MLVEFPQRPNPLSQYMTAKWLSALQYPSEKYVSYHQVENPLRGYYLLQVPCFEGIHLKRIVCIIGAELIHLANFLAYATWNMFIKIIYGCLLVARLHARDLAEELDPLRPRKPLTGSHESASGGQFAESKCPWPSIFCWINVWNENIRRCWELHLDRTIGLLHLLVSTRSHSMVAPAPVLTFANHRPGRKRQLVKK